MKRKALVTATLTVLVLSACGVNNNGANDTALRNRDINEPARVNNPADNNLTYDYNGRRVNDRTNGNTTFDNNRRGVNNNLTDVNNVNNETPRMRVADHIADKIVAMHEVDHANVIVTDNNAYVAAKLENNKTDLSKDVERKIADQVKSVDRDIDNVYISVNPDFYDRMENVSNDIRGGHPIEGLFEGFTNAVRRVFPTHYNR
ncbi:YhcN/YlaJ family sporulation lipoprotein [Neobacillus sp. FSL H8-0543]|uniref:YhcN/YlaJ family sporulation lipoprotein n=1 Tax=Neobacillus sp. FSL H8-0543 TaxID=2954672 RepID=UPI0031594CAE